ncbi:MAG: TauD/TfdA family dioxygenase [Myxococcales bacterium]|nr:TauD/TfdA family dioxygenase [Myxococcales bacterium]
MTAALLDALRRDGLARAFLEDAATRSALEVLGEIVAETEVRQHTGVDTYLAGRGEVPQHTDHPEADFVAWRCEQQDPTAGASVLTDGSVLLNALGSRREALAELVLQVPPQLPRQRTDRRAVLEGDRLYYAPWYRVLAASERGQEALRRFSALLAMGVGRRRIRLQAGEVLIVDNGRWLHGRDELAEGSPRFLRRWWVSAR